jgi:long-chain fatty acid transport protein
MKHLLSTAAILAATTTLATAGGLDRSGQSVLSIFDPENSVTATIGYVMPSVSGRDTAAATGATYDIGKNYTQLGLSYANDVNDQFSYGVIYDQPFGADIFYNGNPAASLLAGTRADLSSNALSVLGKYQINPSISVFGGLKLQQAGGRVSLNGIAYGNALATAGVAAASGTTAQVLGAALQGDPTAFAALPAPLQSPAALGALGAQVTGLSSAFTAGGGYDVQIEQDWGAGFIIGAAYEIPDIALRLAVTYHSEVKHDGASVETAPAALGALAGAGNTPFDSPQSVNIEFQTGIAEDTLLLASMRWTNWDAFDVIPPNLGSDLANISDSYRWTLGVGRRFSDTFSGSATLTYEADAGDAVISPLGPNDGQLGLSVGGQYKKDNMTISGGINYTKVGDAFAGVAGQQVALFEGNSAIGVGLRVNFDF